MGFISVPVRQIQAFGLLHADLDFADVDFAAGSANSRCRPR
jgi:hypothetical protein